MTLAILITTLAFLLALAMRGDDRVRTEYYRRRLTETLEKYPPATVIVPVKGPEEGLAGESCFARATGLSGLRTDRGGSREVGRSCGCDSS